MSVPRARHTVAGRSATRALELLDPRPGVVGDEDPLVPDEEPAVELQILVRTRGLRVDGHLPSLSAGGAPTAG
ncbi:hypothetical protein [Nocardioides lijunqiniae]|uniref:hypothetical protein n=1 Tax=Nocardioides lijunqiniae TaxID=2760832 RepID=UPI001877AD67|nr:hypothetical protein [Nocardioides lijunqiniae]